MDTGIVIALVLVVAIVGILGFFMFLARQQRRGSGEPDTAGRMQVATAGVSSSRAAQTDFPEDYEPVYPAERENELPLSLVVNYLMGLVNDGENAVIRNKLREQGCYWNPVDRSEPIKDFKITFSVDTGDGKKVELGGLSSLMSRWGRDFLTNPATAPERPAETTKEERDESFRKELEENARKEAATEKKEPAREEKPATVTPPSPVEEKPSVQEMIERQLGDEEPKAKDFPRGENGVPEDVLEILRNPLKGMVGLCIYMNKLFGLGIDYSGMDFTGALEQAQDVKEECRNLSFDELCSFVRLSGISFEAMHRAERDLKNRDAYIEHTFGEDEDEESPRPEDFD